MSGPDIVLGLIGAIDVAIKFGKVFVKTCAAYKHADSELSNCNLRVELCWKQISLQLDFLRRIGGELDAQLAQLQEQSLIVLTKVLSTAEAKIRPLLEPKEHGHRGTEDKVPAKTGRRARAKYALLKERFEDVLVELEAWQRRFDPSWYLILRIASKLIDEEIDVTTAGHGNHRPTIDMQAVQGIRGLLSGNSTQQRHLRLDESGLTGTDVVSIPFSTFSMKTVPRANSNTRLILDSRPTPEGLPFDERVRTLRSLAEMLVNADPCKLSLLKCAGYVSSPSTERFTFVFKAPNSERPISLRALLVASTTVRSLSERFRLATQLATAVCSVHTLGFVHKNIRPANVLLFRREKEHLGPAFLLGFEDARYDAGRTYLVGGNKDWAKNLYRHPRRQGDLLREPHDMQHDIYSLGVCLLEIGLWRTFVTCSADDDTHTTPLKGHEDWIGLDGHSGRGNAVKAELVAMAKEALPPVMGTRYAKVVRTCLTCLDEGCSDFGDEADFRDEDGVLVAVRYIEKVLIELNSIMV